MKNKKLHTTTPKKTWGGHPPVPNGTFGRGGFRKVRYSWLPLSRADRKVLRNAPRFLTANRCTSYEKMKSEIKIEVLDIDKGDEMIRFQGFFSNGICSTILEFYGDSNEFQDFADKLIEFPKSTEDKVSFELGEKGNWWAYYLLIEAYCVEVNGRSALKIEAINNEVGPSYYESKFEIESEPASLNMLGNRLKAWNPLEGKVFEWSPNE